MNLQKRLIQTLLRFILIKDSFIFEGYGIESINNYLANVMNKFIIKMI